MKNNAYPNKVKWCPICDQGWIEIFKSRDGKLFLMCNECENDWNSPDTITKESALKASNISAPVEYPTQEEIKEKGWDKYIISK